MQYDNLNDKTADLFDETLSATEKEKIIQQLDKLSGSTDELQLINRTASVLTPKIQIKASKTLKDKVMKQINESTETISGKTGRIIPMLGSTWKKIASIAAILLVALAIVPIFGPKFFNPNAKALSLLNTSIEAILNIKSMVINYQVRSVPGDNLDLIDIKGDFIDYKLWKEFIPSEKWRIQKPGLAVVMDGQKQYRYMEKSGVGLVASPEAGFVEWMQILLDPPSTAVVRAQWLSSSSRMMQGKRREITNNSLKGMKQGERFRKRNKQQYFLTVVKVTYIF